MASIHLPIRQLVEFLLRTGSIDSRFTGFDRANEGARIHRRLQKAAGEGYQAEVFLSAEREACGIAFTLEGRADGIFTDETGTVTIDEIKTTTVPYEEITEELNPCHWAQGMVYGAIHSRRQALDALAVRLTYYQIDTDQILRFTRRFTRQELEQFLQQLLAQYAPWAQRQLDWNAYLQQVHTALSARWPDIDTLVQQRDLDDAGRADFLARFVPHPARTLLGFAVMGGIFGEGVDLAGDRLIGCAIVGVGLPQVNPRQEMLRRYYEAQAGCGFDYAYRYPGMNKVLQAAGRVVRTPQDRGVVLLLDDRFAQADTARLFPPHWQHIRYLPDTAALTAALDAFWNNP